MNNLDRISSSTALDPVSFSRGYATYLGTLLQKLDHEKVGECIQQLEDARQHGNTVFIVGNGGSASTASHTANDFSSAVIKKTIKPVDKSYRAFSLTDNVSMITAIANDSSYEHIFLDQLKVHFKPGDKLIAISASGNSPNVVIAAEWVKQQGGTVIGWLGFDGGRLKEIADLPIIIDTPRGEYAPVEDMHLVINHIIVTWMHYHILEEQSGN
jgi:D-sedoheptulose 7-phosphate isomerase